MAKDIIYIDVEDDITSIIGKVKASKESVVALVPPKRIGALQSVVNLRLLARAAKQSQKHLALITTNDALKGLASVASIPVAKTLQSQPELEVISHAKIDDDNDVIEGSTLPIGEHAQQTDPETKVEKKSAAMAAALADSDKTTSSASVTPKKASTKPKIPDFNSFRKKLLLAGLLLFALVAFFVWANVIAVHATIIVGAKTSGTSINAPVTIADNVKTDFKAATIHAAVEQSQEQKSVTFTPTGKKDVGSKATGTVNFTNNSTSTRTVAAGEQLKTSGGLVFTVDETVSVPAGAVSCPTIFSCSGTAGQATGSVTAAENGSKYNAASGNLSGTPSSVSASFTDATSGGVTKMVTIVTAADIQKAKQSLSDDKNENVISDLKSKFGKDSIVIDQSFSTSYDNTTSSPDVGQEASGSATLNTTITYKLYGVSRDEVGKYLDARMKQELEGADNQRVYDNGSNKASFQDITASVHGGKATLIATAKVGPKITDQQVKDISKGKQYGDIQEGLKQIPGVQSVQVDYFPPWFNTVPDDNNRITVQFKLNESN